MNSALTDTDSRQQGRNEGNVLFNDALNTFYFTVIWRRSRQQDVESVRFNLQAVTAHACHGHTLQLSAGLSI